MHTRQPSTVASENGIDVLTVLHVRIISDTHFTSDIP